MLFLFSVIFLVALLALLTGLIKPLSVKMETRKGVVKVFGAITLIGLVGTLVMGPQTQEYPIKNNQIYSFHAKNQLQEILSKTIHPKVRKKIVVHLFYFSIKNRHFLKCMSRIAHCGIFEVIQQKNDNNDPYKFTIHWVNGNSKDWKLEGITQSSNKKLKVKEILEAALSNSEVYAANLKSLMNEIFPSIDVALTSEDMIRWLFITVKYSEWSATSKIDRREFLEGLVINMKKTFPNDALTMRVTVGENGGGGNVLGNVKWGPLASRPTIKIH